MLELTSGLHPHVHINMQILQYMLKNKLSGQEGATPILHMRTLRHRKIKAQQLNARLPRQLWMALGALRRMVWSLNQWLPWARLLQSKVQVRESHPEEAGQEDLIMTTPPDHLGCRGNLCSEIGKVSQEDPKPLDPEGQVSDL